MKKKKKAHNPIRSKRNVIECAEAGRIGNIFNMHMLRFTHHIETVDVVYLPVVYPYVVHL